MSNNLFFKSPSKLSCLSIIYKAGAAYESQTLDSGVSHLLEHMICRATKPMEDELQIRGIEWNALTYTDCVVFYLRGLDYQIEAVAEKWLNAIIGYKPNIKDYETELPIVAQEAKDGENKPDNVYFHNLFLSKYGYTMSIGHIPLLEKLGIKGVTKSHARLFSSPYAIVYCGKKKLKFNCKFPKAKDLTFTSPSYQLPLLKATDANTGIVTVTTGQAMSTSDEIWGIGKMAMDAFGDGLNSPLYQVLREKLGLTYACAAFIQDIHKDAIIPMIYAKCSKENYEKVQQEILNLIGKPEKWLTKKRLEIVKSAEMVQKQLNEQEPYKLHYILRSTYNSHKTVDVSNVTKEQCIDWIKKTFKSVLVCNSDSR